MDVINLLVVLVFNIMYLNSKIEKMNLLEEKLLQVQIIIVEILIKSVVLIGMVFNEVFEKVFFIIEIFGIDDELDVSCDIFEEFRDYFKKKDKRRKRLGLF